MFSLIKSDFASRCLDIRCLHEHIVKVSDEKGTVKISSILKAAVFIALYNNVESTFYSIFEKIHIEANKIGYSYLNIKLRNKVKLFYHKDKNIDDCLCENLKFPLLVPFLKKENLFSGNLDMRKGRAIFRTYGIDFDNRFELRKLNSLLIIKNKRNKIAHGELSFPDAGKTISPKSLLSIIDSSEEILLEFIAQAEAFLSSNGITSESETKQPMLL